MGVTGLWRLIEPAGKPVPVETLENKVLAVDISIWLHQMVKGYQDAKGAPLPNAHLMGLFQRLCKLLYFRIKPVFVFDGGFPDLKRETIAKRQDSKSKYNSQSEKLKREIALLLGKKTAIGALLGKQISPKKNKPVESNDDIFKLPALPEKEIDSESESESEDEHSSSASSIDLHSVDLESEKFKNMPLKEKYDLLIELKETRKMNSWGKIHTLPKKSDNFSNFQMERLLKRRKLQECLEETEKEMGDGCMSLNELESLLNEEGIDTKIESLPSRRIASNDTTRYLLISNVRKALEDAKKRENAEKEAAKQKEVTEETEKSTENVIKEAKHDELEDDLQKAIKMSLECVDEPETSANTSKADDSWTSCLTDSDYSEDDDGFEPPDMSSAKGYIMQYTDFTHEAIDSLVTEKQKEKHKNKTSKVNKIIEELNKEKSIIEDNIDLLSSDDENILTKVNQLENSKTHNNAEKRDVDIIKETQEIFSKTEITTDAKENKGEILDVDMNETQASVICMGNPADEVITLDTSQDEMTALNTQTADKLKSIPDEELSKESSSSEDEFEEVSDIDQKPSKPGIELTLNMGSEIEDDIFADVFEENIGKKKVTEDEVKITVIEKSNDIKHENILIDESVVVVKDQQNKEAMKGNQKSKEKVIIMNKNVEKDVKAQKIDEPSEKPLEKQEVYEKLSNERPNTTEQETISTEKPSNKRPNTIEQDTISTEKLQSIATDIEVEEAGLLQEKGRLDRIGRNITEQMTKEAQELLQVFGIPYIIAPMEAEAQCAFLESVKLTDGTITDDSDIWLFGGKTVYKNFFNQKKHVLQFLSERIERSFNLTREQLILLALLVGSDYTTGVTGVGPVTALEILASFPLNKKKLLNENANKQALYQEIVTGLQEFKKWVRAGKRTDNVSLKKKLKNVSLTDDFPSVRVVQAYLEPNVEKSEERFTWGEIDITILRDYTKSKFGWSQNKLDEIMKPVLKRLLERKSQKTVHDYFKRKLDFNNLEDQMSKRVKAAVQKMGPEPLQESNIDQESEVPSKKRKITKPKDSKAGPSKPRNKNKKQNDEVTQIKEVVKSSAVESPVLVVENEIDIPIPKTGRVQEIIPQREKDKKHLLENKLKAIEVFRKTKIDRKRKPTKRKLPVPKEKAELSESDSD